MVNLLYRSSSAATVPTTTSVSPGPLTNLQMDGNFKSIKDSIEDIADGTTPPASATKLVTGRTIALTGDVTYTSPSFDGSQNVTATATLANSGVTAGTYTKVTVDTKGRATAGALLTAADIPELTLAKMPGSTYKQSVRCATTANITLSALQTIDGIVTVAGDRVLVKNQTTVSQNGIYVVAVGAWTRSLDADVSEEIGAAVVAVDSGTVNGGEVWTTTFKTTDTLGTTNMNWYEVLYNSGTWAINAATAATLTTARTIGGVSFDGSANINLPGVNTAGNQNTSGNAATATILATSRNIGGVSFNGSADITLPGVNSAGNQNTSGNAATATTATTAATLTTARNIGGVSFDGSADINLPGVNTAGNQNTSGNAATATKLAAARTIGGVSFDGSANINLPGVNTAGTQNTSGNAATATTAATLTTGRNIGGVLFDGSVDISLPGVNATGNQNTSGNAATATKLATARTIGGVSFDGSANISLPGVNIAGTQNTTGSAASLSGITTTAIPTSALASGTADTTTFLRGDRTWVTVTSGISGLTISDDTTTNATRYLTFTSSTTGSISTENVSSTKLTFNPSSGSLTATGYNTVSDRNNKDNIAPIADPVGIINQIDGVSFNWKSGGEKSYGVIAQEIEKILPELVTSSENGLSVSYIPLIAILLEAVKEQERRIIKIEQSINKI